MKAIVLPIYNRPHYLRQLLESICNAEEYHLFAAVEPSDKVADIAILLYEFKNKFASVTASGSPIHKGMIQNTFDAFELTINNGAHFIVCLEDDLWLSPDFFSLMDYYEKTYKDNPLIYGAYGGQGGNINTDPQTLIEDCYFYGNGWAVFTENWQEYFAPNWFSSDMAMKHFNASGNDWNISGVFREHNIKMLIPTLARSKHIGINGAHHNAQIYQELCANKIVNKEHYVEEFRLCAAR